MIPLDHLLTQDLTRQAVTGRTGAGDPTFAAQTTTAKAARFEEDVKLIIDNEGNKLRVDTLLTTRVDLDRRDRIWPPGADITKLNEARRIATLKKARHPYDNSLVVEARL